MLNPQRALNSKFGPTYPPSAHPSFAEELVLSYPGVVFAFCKDGAPVVKSNGAPAAKKVENTSNTASESKCPLTRLVVSRHDPSANHATAYPDVMKLEQYSTPYTVAEGDIAYVDIEVSNTWLQGREQVCSHVSLRMYSSMRSLALRRKPLYT